MLRLKWFLTVSLRYTKWERTRERERGSEREREGDLCLQRQMKVDRDVTVFRRAPVPARRWPGSLIRCRWSV